MSHQSGDPPITSPTTRLLVALSLTASATLVLLRATVEGAVTGRAIEANLLLERIVPVAAIAAAWRWRASGGRVSAWFASAAAAVLMALGALTAFAERAAWSSWPAVLAPTLGVGIALVAWLGLR